jgi:hypothetical protein
MSNNLTVDKIDSSILTLQSLEAEFDLVMTQYKQAYADYINSLQTRTTETSSKREFTVTQGQRYWGTSGIKDVVVNKVEECQAACAEDAKCTGATFNASSGYCWVRSGSGSVTVGNNNNEYAIMPVISQNINNLKYLNDRLVELNQKIISELNKTEPIVLNEIENKDIRRMEMEEANQKLMEERKQIYDLLDQHNDLNSQYDENSLYVNQSNAQYIVWSVIAIVIIVLIVRLVVMPESSLIDHVKFAFVIILIFIFIVTLTKMYNPTGFLFFGLFVILIIIMVMGKINKKPGFGSESSYGSGIGYERTNMF